MSYQMNFNKISDKFNVFYEGINESITKIINKLK